jgi:hypothetical protein
VQWVVGQQKRFRNRINASAIVTVVVAVVLEPAVCIVVIMLVILVVTGDGGFSVDSAAVASFGVNFGGRFRETPKHCTNDPRATQGLEVGMV